MKETEGGGTFCLVMGILGAFTASLIVAPALAVLAGLAGLSDWPNANRAYKTKVVIGFLLGVLFLWSGIMHHNIR